MTAYTKITMKATKGFGKLSFNNTFFDDIWFNIVTTEEEGHTYGIDYFRLEKTNQRGFLLSILKN